MSEPHIKQVRQALLATLKDLRDKQDPMDIERAKAVALVAGVLVDTARVENDFLKITNQDHCEFLEQPKTTTLATNRTGEPSANNPFPTSVVHRL